MQEFWPARSSLLGLNKSCKLFPYTELLFLKTFILFQLKILVRSPQSKAFKYRYFKMKIKSLLIWFNSKTIWILQGKILLSWILKKKYTMQTICRFVKLYGELLWKKDHTCEFYSKRELLWKKCLCVLMQSACTK